MPVVDLEAVAAHLGFTPTNTQAAELANFIAAAEARLSHEVGELTPREITERHRGDGPIVLRRRPVTAVLSVNAVAVSAAHVDLDSGIIYVSAYGDVSTVTYTAGYQPLPYDLRQAVLELVRHLWATQRGSATPNGARSNLTGADSGAMASGTSFSLPHRVMELIQPYRTTPVA